MRWILVAILSAALSVGCSAGVTGDVQAVDEALRKICGAFRDGNAAPGVPPGWTASDRRGETSYFKFDDWGRVNVRVLGGNGPTRCAIDLFPGSLEAKPNHDAFYKLVSAFVAERYPDARLDKNREEGPGRGGFLVTYWTAERDYIGFGEFPAQPFIAVVQVTWQWPV